MKRYVQEYIGKKYIVYIEFGTIHSFRHPLGLLEHTRLRQGGTTVFYSGISYVCAVCRRLPKTGMSRKESVFCFTRSAPFILIFIPDHTLEGGRRADFVVFP